MTRLLLNLDPEQLTRINEYQRAGAFASRLDAIRTLIDAGLCAQGLPEDAMTARPRRRRNVLTIPEVLAFTAGRDALSAREMMAGVRENTRNWITITTTLVAAGWTPGPVPGNWVRLPAAEVSSR